MFIFFSLPYRVPCRSGICTSAIEVTSSQLIATEVYPAIIVKALLFPGAIANAIINKRTIPSYSRLLNFYNFTYVKKAHATADLQRLEVCKISTMLALEKNSGFWYLEFLWFIISFWVLKLIGPGSCRKLPVNCRGIFWTYKARKSEPVWDTTPDMGSSQRNVFFKKLRQWHNSEKSCLYQPNNVTSCGLCFLVYKKGCKKTNPFL